MDKPRLYNLSNNGTHLEWIEFSVNGVLRSNVIRRSPMHVKLRETKIAVRGVGKRTTRNGHLSSDDVQLSCKMIDWCE